MNTSEIQFKYTPTFEIEEGFNQGAIFNRVYFRIETSTYRPKDGMPQFQTDHEREEFYTLMNDFFKGLGFKAEDNAHKNTRVFKGAHSQIHLHPDDLSGLVSDDELQLIHEKLIEFTDRHPIFNHRWTEVTQRYEDISETEIIHRVNTSKDKIIDVILKAMKTSRTTKFKRPLAWTNLIEKSELKGFQFVSSPEIFQVFNGALEGFVSELIEQGWIKIFAEDNGEIKGYRAANKEESRQVKRDIKASANALIPNIMQNSKSDK